MRTLCDLKLKCSQCGGYGVEIVLFFNGAQADAFWEGQEYADVWDLRLYGEDLNEFPAKMYKDHPNPFRSGVASSDEPVPGGLIPIRSLV